MIEFECDAKDADPRIAAGIAVLSLATDRGRVVISMTPEVLERLSVRIQFELAASQNPPLRKAAGS